MERLERRTVTIPYPWVEGEPLTVAVVTSTGLTFSTEIAVATQSPPVDARYLGTFALLGIYAGVIPVFIGLLWLPFVRSIERRWIDFFLSLTIGLLVFLGVDALEEALDTSALRPRRLPGDRRSSSSACSAPRSSSARSANGARARAGSARRSTWRRSSRSASGCTTWAKGSRSAPRTPPARSRSAPSW